jgi:hypothetical protein
MTESLVGACFLLVAYLGLAAFTAAGARRRGLSAWLAAVCGLFFPVTWTVWYLVDERPFGRAGGGRRGGRLPDGAEHG